MVVIQAGHLNIGENCSWSLREDTGQPGEVETVIAVCQRVAAALSARQVPVMVTDANFNCLDAAKHDYQAVVSLHTGPPAIGVGHPEADGAAPDSERLAALITKRFAEHTGVQPGSHAEDAIDHYLFQVLSSSSPWALVVIGEVADVEGVLDQVVDGLAVGLLEFLGLPAVEPEPEWRSNLQPHATTIVLNRPVRMIDLSNGIAGNPTTENVLQVAFLTQVAGVMYYVPQLTAQGADPAIGWLKSEVDAAAGMAIPASPAPLPAPPAPPKTPAPIPPPAGGPARPASVRLQELLHELQAIVPELITELTPNPPSTGPGA